MPQAIALDHFGFLKISGVDAVSFLQGYTTCDLAALTDDTAQLGAICNIQGRMLASFIAVRQDQGLVLRMHASLVSTTIKFLAKYIVFSKAELQDISDSLRCYGVLSTGSPPSSSPYSVKYDQGNIRVNLGNREEHWMNSNEVLSGLLSEQDSIADWTDAEVEAGTAWVDETSSGEYLPQMLNYHQLGGISFTKGCYLGQEIVARMQYRGELKKRLHRIEAASTNRNLQAGNLVVSGSRACLAVLANPDGTAIEVSWDDGTSSSATPLEPIA